MKSYHVILTCLVDPVRDVDVERPETKDYRFDVMAENEHSAKLKAAESHGLSIWESLVYENG